ncbi:MAG TPA: hypothetical protein VHE61_00335 [Opitutaceae bacterium]|nr:hypothetical protein [Opitutaceae bacterium]
MITLASLWLPILLSAVFVFVASSIVHMALPWHRSDFRKTPNEDAVMDALRPFSLPPGDYLLPRCDHPSQLKSPEFSAKMERGPVMIYTVLPNGKVAMGKNLLMWFIYLLVVSAIAAYLATKTVAAGATYHRVFGVIGVACFLGFSGALWQSSIWFSRSWATTLKSTIDGAIYAGIAAGTFGWLWPR